MGDDTRELLNAHHASILRELDNLNTNLRHDLSGLKGDMATTREWQDTHTTEDNKRFSHIDNRLGVLMWAYGVGAFVIAAFVAKMGWGQ